MPLYLNPARSGALARWAGWITVILLPALITAVMVKLQYTGCMQPGFNDEVSQWHQVKTFSEVGFHGGYYTWNEKVAKLSFVHFGNWGPGFAMLFGSLGNLFGWHPESTVYYNTGVLTLALGVLVFVTRPAPRQTVLLVFLFATFWPVLLYAPRTMQMTLHASFAILFATLFYERITLKHRAGSINLCFTLLLAVAATVQFTWMLIAFPWLLTRPGIINGRQALIRIASAVGLNVLGAAYFLSMASPYATNNAGDVIRAAQAGLKPVVDLIMPRFFYIASLRGDTFESILWVQCALLLTILTFLSRHWIHAKLRGWATSSPKLLAIVALCVFTAALLVFCAALNFKHGVYFVIPLVVLLYPVTSSLISKLKNSDPEKRNPAVPIDSYLLAAGLSVVLALGIAILFGYPDAHRAYRLVAPFFLVGCLMLILGKHIHAALIVIAVAVVGVPSFFDYYHKLGEQSWFSCDTTASMRQFKNQIRPHLAFNPVTDPWCNTLLFEVDAFQPELVTVPPGIGLSFIYATDPVSLEMPLKSKYVLVGPKVLRLLDERGARLNLLTNTTLGGLYLNADAHCSP